jgi:hypothetical protein
MPSDGGYKIFNDGMLVGHYSTKFFKNNYEEVVKFGVRNNIFSENSTVSKVVNSIRDIDTRSKKFLIKEMEKRFKFTYPNSVYTPTLQEVEGYDVIPIPVKELSKTKKTEFGINVPYNINYNFLGSQFIKFVFERPTLETVPTIPQGSEVRYWAPPHPGIRLIDEAFVTSDNTVFDNYTSYDVLKYQNDSIPDNVYEAWNDLMGHDLGKEASVYNISESVHQVLKYKDGYQTAKADPGELVLHVPLLFAHNRNLNDKLNMSIFNKKTIRIGGRLTESTNMVKAALFSTTSVSTPPEELSVKPLKIKSCSLINLTSAVNDVMFALNLGLYYNKMYDYVKHDRYPITNKKGEIKLRGNGEVLQMGIIARPISYHRDFDKWCEFTPVDYKCAYVPIVVDDPVNAGMKKLSIATAKLYNSIPPFKNVNLKYEGVHLMNDGSTDGEGDSALWHTIDPFVKLLKYPGYFIRKRGMIYFNFNPHVNTKRIGCVFNMSKFRDPQLSYEISDLVGFNVAMDLNETLEVFVFRNILNNHVMAGDTITKAVVN